MNVRPMYETQFDLDNEGSAKSRIEKAFKCVLHKLPISYSADWVATRNNEIVAVLEYKKRTCEKDKFPTTFIFVDKWMNGQRLSDTMSVPFFLLIEWTDGLYWHQVGSTPVTFKVSGRTDRGDPQDIQPAVHIPVTAFTKVN
jgi:hypothetical protein